MGGFGQITGCLGKDCWLLLLTEQQQPYVVPDSLYLSFHISLLLLVWHSVASGPEVLFWHSTVSDSFAHKFVIIVLLFFHSFTFLHSSFQLHTQTFVITSLMPQRPSRASNARNNKQRVQRLASPSLSPPAQLPTPLPDEQIPNFSQLHLPTAMDPPVAQQQSLGSPFGREAWSETSSSRLIDLDTPPFQLASLPTEEVNLDDQEEDDSGGALASTYRSPPFREAPLPNQVGSPPPLPIPPRIPYPQDYFEDMGPNDLVDLGLTGHDRPPTFSRYVLCLSRFVSDEAVPIFRSTVLLFSYGGLSVALAAVTKDITTELMLAKW